MYDLKQLKQFWMRVSFTDGFRFGAGFVIGGCTVYGAVMILLAIVTFLVSLIFGFFEPDVILPPSKESSEVIKYVSSYFF